MALRRMQKQLQMVLIPSLGHCFFYVKNAHRPIIAGLEEFLEEYVSEESLGPDGYLSERGLVVLPDQERETMREAVTNGISFKM